MKKFLITGINVFTAEDNFDKGEVANIGSDWLNCDIQADTISELKLKFAEYCGIYNGNVEGVVAVSVIETNDIRLDTGKLTDLTDFDRDVDMEEFNSGRINAASHQYSATVYVVRPATAEDEGVIA